MPYSESRAWSDRFIDPIKRIVGPLMLEESSMEIDTQQVTDLMVMTAKDIRIAARVRDYRYMDRYPYDFTIRSKGAIYKTELQKIVDGWGDWMFYGFSNEARDDIARWYVISFRAFRANLIRRRSSIRYMEKPNMDGQTGLTAFDIRTFTPDILVQSSHEVPFH